MTSARNTSTNTFNVTSPAWQRVGLTGHHLLEASAGTGKTFTVALLYLRALLGYGTHKNDPLTVRQILVVTFTNAATEELIARIRKRIKEAIFYLNTIDSPSELKDKELLGLLEKVIQETPRDKKQCKTLLEIALRDIGFSNISTIHQFSSNICSQVALGGGFPLPIKLSISEQVLDDSVEDIWRSCANNTDIHYSNKINGLKRHKDVYRKIIEKVSPEDKRKAQAIDIFSITEKEIPKDKFYTLLDMRPAKQELESWFSSFEHVFKSKKYTELQDKIKKLTELNKNSEAISKSVIQFFSTSHLRGIVKITELKKDTKLAEDYETLITEKLFFKFCETNKPENGKGNFKVFCTESLNKQIAKLEDKLKAEEEKSGEFYSDRLLQHAARVTRNPNVANQVRVALPLAIVDEFQDTDPFQFEVFSNIYNEKSSGSGTSTGLVMVGDPKQAIYRFRGGDIYTYISAKPDEDNHFHKLTANFRSCASMVYGLNALFTHRSKENQNFKAFDYDKIDYEPVTPKAEKTNLYIKENEQWHNLKSVDAIYIGDNLSGSLSKDKIRNVVVNHTVKYVKSLLALSQEERCATEHRKSGKISYLQPADIGILVNSHKEARLIKSELEKRHIPALIQSKQSIFEEPEAYDCWTILRCLADPQDIQNFRSALAVKLSGQSLEQIYTRLNTPTLLQKSIERVNEIKMLLDKHGAMVALCAWMKMLDTKIIPDSSKNERQASNFLQLCEWLQEEQQTSGGIEKLLAKLEKQISAPDSSEDNLLRLESDQKRVRVSTIHRAKGLEYPVVLLPFAFDMKTKRTGSPPYDGVNGTKRILSFCDSIKELQKSELDKEQLRLFYVAMTRASQHLLTFFIDSGKENELSAEHNKSALGWFFPSDDDTSSVETAKRKFDVAIADGKEKFEQKNAVKLKEQALYDFNIPTYRSITPKEERQQFSPLPFEGAIDGHFGITSFSSLINGYDPEIKGGGEDPENGQSNQKTINVATKHERFNLARGAAIGSALHSVLEHVDFRAWHPKTGDKVKAQKQLSFELNKNLKLYGVVSDDADTEAYERWLTDVITTVFTINSHDSNCNETNISLAQLVQWLPELSFTFRFDNSLSKYSLENALKGSKYQISELTHNDISGFLTGEIDLVFQQDQKYYLVDYKSNYLGDNFSYYTKDMLEANIKQKGYHLQYLIYTLALHKYLENRVKDYNYDTHFGGVYYLYLRGMAQNEKTNTGVFFDKPDKAILEKMDKCLGCNVDYGRDGGL